MTVKGKAPRIGPEEVEHIAQLAKIEISDKDLEIFAHQLSTILQHFRTLQEVDTIGVRPTAQVLPQYNVLRQDEVAPSLSPKEVLANAPQIEKDYIKVPPIRE